MTAFISNERRARLIEGVHAAGREVIAVYQRDFSVETKDDQSPLTEADMAAHHSLVALLENLTPDVPVLSEESDEVPFATRQTWERYWLVDPLDGTKEFINKNGEFTLNVALIENGVPVFGIVYAPVLQTTWVGQVGGEVFKIAQGIYINIQVRELPDPETAPWKVVGSRRHGAEIFEAFCGGLPAHECVSMGSSIKLCLVAEGNADLYPRLTPTSEWDTAAAQAIVTAAGGEVLNAETLEPLRCNQQESVLNPHFIVCGQRDSRWEEALKKATAL
ncbi:3'(2'),5'-bisphosphate nucleotidase CysQ [Vreelandella janggokensis]|uniref:3'(2'),5'-bisphosphate nucleotidase CysQ n=1 Tax=Vreelandella janggokensis TaxID=370767 RepID=A0ABT4IRW2_9GAMM|nr:3'(2'),5'-bisphosphate nucleotidase CysQ [Halomonas janggokensis]MCZ0925759.1 3'(2'),5'-bisphosphate nucleotidase CysQ [Halomonas janggokensis]